MSTDLRDKIEEKRADEIEVGDLVLAGAGDWKVVSIEEYGDRDLVLHSAARSWAVTCCRDAKFDVIPKAFAP